MSTDLNIRIGIPYTGLVKWLGEELFEGATEYHDMPREPLTAH